MRTDRFLRRLLMACFLLTGSLLAQPATTPAPLTTPPPSTPPAAVTRVAYFPVKLVGSYQPLSAAQVDETFLAALKAGGSNLEWVPLTLELANVNPETAIEQALAAAQADGAQLIAWGDIRFDRSSQTARGDSFNRGRLKLLITAEANIQVVRVSDQERLLSQPTMVTSTDLSNAYTETGDPETEARLAKESLREAADSVAGVIRKRLNP